MPRWHIYLTMFLAVFTFAGTASAEFPSCEPLANNAPLNPEPNGKYPSDPAILFAGGQTSWSRTGVEIKVSVNQAAPTQFFIKGVNYEPTQIGGAASFSPFNDFFYTNSVKTWVPLWDRDIKTLRAIGVNSIRTYGWWKWEPGFNKAPPPHKGKPVLDGVADFWPLLNFQATEASENDNQFCDPDDKSVFTFQHTTHDDFLNRLWNNGKNPIYVWLGLSVPLDLVDPNVSAARKANLRQFYRYTAKWMAKKYGDHPAVIGFVIGNEIDTPATTRTSEFWETLNDLDQVVKASAPHKLTAVTFHDTADYNDMITTGAFKGKRGPEVYEPDVWGFNPYTNPAPPGNLFSRFQDNVVDVCAKAGSGCEVKPLMYGEFGTPADTHKVSSVKAKAYPLQWVAENFIWQAAPPPARCLEPDDQGPPPGSGGDGPVAEFKANKTIAVEMAAGKNPYPMPATLAADFASSGVKAGQPLPAGAQADWVAEFWKVTERHKASNGAERDNLHLYSSGGYAFEWRDEWWKANESHPYFHSISGNQQCGASWSGCPSSCANTGAANVVFPGGWGDEEWFGMVGARANGRKNSDPVVNQFTGKLNGGPDILEPRAAVAALCSLFRPDMCP